MNPARSMDVVVLASGNGSNLRAIAAAIDAGRCGAVLRAVVSDRAKAGALAFATERGVPTRVVPLQKGADRTAWNRTLAEELGSLAPDLIVLAGFMRVLGPEVVSRFAGRIVNVHPSLLPAFPGTDAPQQALDAGVCITGCTVHLVDEGVDTGPILAQAAVPVVAGDDRDTLHGRIQHAEHRLLPAVLDWIARGDLVLEGGPRFVRPPAFRGDILWAPAAPEASS